MQCLFEITKKLIPRLTEQDVANITGTTIKGYRVEAVKIKSGPFVDSDHYGIILGKNTKDEYVTWEFHLKDDESVFVYWGHFIMDREEAFRDFNARGIDSPQWFDVTITETLQLTVRVEARSQQEAEQIVSNDWKKQEYVLGPECFAGVEFQATPVVESGELS